MSAFAVAASSDAAGFQPDEGGPQPTPLLQLWDSDAPKWGGRDEIRLVAFETARNWFSRYHYSGTVPAGAWMYGVFRGDLIAVVAIDIPTNNISGVAAKFDLEGWPGNLEVARVAVHPAAPRNTASQVLSRVLRRAANDLAVSWLFSYADTGQGHHGGIYQALRAVYVGVSPGADGYAYNGRPVHPRWVVDRFGSRSRDRIAQIPGLEHVEDAISAKHTYILPIGPFAAEVRAHLERFRRPYPKRVP